MPLRVFSSSSFRFAIATLLTLGAAMSVHGQEPDWTVDPSDFEFTMNVTGALFVGEARSDDADAVVAAFVNGEVRGVAEPSEVEGEELYFMTIYAHAGEGETVTFKAYDARADAVKEARETFSFSAQDVRGTPASPFAWHVAASSGLQAPALAAPSDGVQLDDARPILRWQAAPGADTYRLQISTSTSFTTSMLYTGLADTARSMPSLKGRTQYYWRVRAASAQDQSGWSSPFSFTTAERTAVDEPRKNSPDALKLKSNYPNPFFQATTISFGLPKPTSVRLRVLDASGREVAKLIDGVLAPGWHQAQWQAGGVASGVYFYQLSAGSVVENRKMVVSR